MLLDASGRGLYRAAYSSFGKAGQVASEEVVIQCWYLANACQYYYIAQKLVP